MDVVLKILAGIALIKASMDLIILFSFTKLIMLLASIIILALCFFSLKRSGETKEFLIDGINKSLDDINSDDFEIDLQRFGKHTRYFVASLSFISLAYWLGVRAYVSMALGLTGALLVFAEFVLNFEVVNYLTSDPHATFSESSATQVITVYKAISSVHIAAITTVIGLIVIS